MSIRQSSDFYTEQLFHRSSPTQMLPVDVLAEANAVQFSIDGANIMFELPENEMLRQMELNHIKDFKRMLSLIFVVGVLEGKRQVREALGVGA